MTDWPNVAPDQPAVPYSTPEREGTSYLPSERRAAGPVLFVLGLIPHITLTLNLASY